MAETKITADVQKREGPYSAVVVEAGDYRCTLCILPHKDAEEVARRINGAEGGESRAESQKKPRKRKASDGKDVD